MSNPDLVKTPVIDKNGHATTRNKRPEGATATTAARVAGAAVPTSGSSGSNTYNEYMDDVDAIVAVGLRKGLLKEVKTMNGDARFQTDDILLGRNDEGDRIYATMTLEHINKPRKTTTLDEREESWDVSFMGIIKRKGYAEGGGGQISDSVRELTTGLGSELANEFADLWDKNHLNGLNAGTETQKTQADAILAETGERYDYGVLSPQIPDDNGYKYGSGWLHRDVPSEDIDRALGILFEAKGMIIE